MINQSNSSLIRLERFRFSFDMSDLSYQAVSVSSASFLLFILKKRFNGSLCLNNAELQALLLNLVCQLAADWLISLSFLSSSLQSISICPMWNRYNLHVFSCSRVTSSRFHFLSCTVWGRGDSFFFFQLGNSQCSVIGKKKKKKKALINLCWTQTSLLVTERLRRDLYVLLWKQD